MEWKNGKTDQEACKICVKLEFLEKKINRKQTMEIENSRKDLMPMLRVDRIGSYPPKTIWCKAFWG